MKTILSVLLLCVTISAQAVEPYVKLNFSTIRGETDAPSLSPSHPVSSSSLGDSTTDMSGMSVMLGTKFGAGWYTEIGFVDLDETFRNGASSGSDASFTYNTRHSVNRSIKGVQLNLGKEFAINPSFSIAPVVGVLYAKDRKSETMTTDQIGPCAPLCTVVTTETRVNEEDKKFFGAYGVVFQLNMTPKVGAFINPVVYPDADRTVINIGGRVIF